MQGVHNGIFKLGLACAVLAPCADADWGFDEVSAQTIEGWRFVLSEPGLDGRDLMSGGLAAADVNRDGRVDLFIPRGDFLSPMLLLNRGDGRFEDATERWNLPTDAAGAMMRYATGAAFADLDGNGYPDLVLGGVRGFGMRVFFNLGARFERAPDDFGLATDAQDTWSLAFGDADGDGRLDLAAGHWSLAEPRGSRGGHLWLNRSDGFIDVSKTWAVADAFRREDFSFTPNFADLDGDLRPELLVAADFGTSQVFANLDGLTMRRITSPVISDENGMGATLGDFDGDSIPDWFVTSIWSDLYLVDPTAGFSGNRLYRGDGAAGFADFTNHAGVRRGYWGWGACAADFDNSGTTDLFHVNGFLDTVDDPARLFINLGDARFEQQAEARGIADPGQGRGIVCFDYDLDGDIDVFIQNNGQSGRLYRNSAVDGSRHWVGIRLHGHGTNKRAIGARVAVAAGGRVQVREMTIPNHYLSTSPAELHFGLGDTTAVDWIEIAWPDGTLERVIAPAVDRWLIAIPGCGVRTQLHLRRAALAEGCIATRKSRYLRRALLNRGDGAATGLVRFPTGR